MKVLALLFAYGQSSHLHLHVTPPRDDLSIRKSRVNYNERHIPLRNFTSIPRQPLTVNTFSLDWKHCKSRILDAEKQDLLGACRQ